MRTLMLILGLSLLSCQSTTSKNENNLSDKVQNRVPNYEVGVQFVNDYVDYCNNRNSNIGLIEWIESQSNVTSDFKLELKRIIEKAEKENTEHGLCFDPILDAQDNPNKFEIDNRESEFLIVKGIKWSDFRLTLKLKFVENKWLVDGSGIINVPMDKRIKR